VSGVVLVLGCALLAGCATAPSGKKSKYMFPEGGRWGEAAKRRYNDGEAIPPGGGRAMVGKPYDVDGRTYYPKEDPNYDRVGMSSWYGVDFHGRDTANGEVYDRHTLSAAHPTMPLPSYARVTNLRNGKSVIVRVNDRGPYIDGREIDVSEKAADMLGYKSLGVAKVRVQYIGPAPVEGSNQQMLASSFRDDGGPSVVSDRMMIARAEGREMPKSTERPVMVASLEPKSRTLEPLGSLAHAPAPDKVPVLPPMASPAQQPVRAGAVVASAQFPPPANPRQTAMVAQPAQRVVQPIAPLPQTRAKPGDVVVPAEILAAVRPQSKPQMAPPPTYIQPMPPVAANVGGLPRRKPSPDDSLPAGWETPTPGSRSYAPTRKSKMDALFAKVTDD
jgi:rare lipoprotein A